MGNVRQAVPASRRARGDRVSTADGGGLADAQELLRNPIPQASDVYPEWRHVARTRAIGTLTWAGALARRLHPVPRPARPGKRLSPAHRGVPPARHAEEARDRRRAFAFRG